MINKKYKTINNKFSRFFNFVFFFRYLLVIFFITLVLFLLIPQLFDYKKREETIKTYLLKNYGIKIIKLNTIEFNSFPIPYLELEGLLSNLNSKNLEIKTEKLIIYPKLFSIYNFNNFDVRKIKLINNDTKINFQELKFFSKNILKLEKKINFTNLNLEIRDRNKKIIDLKNINFSNFGYKKNTITGEIFGKKFKIKLNSNLSKINFEILETGVSAILYVSETKLDSKNQLQLKGKILKSNFKLDVIYDESLIEIDNFIFRNKELSFDGNGLLKLKPFFKINTKSLVKEFNIKLLSNLDIEYLISFKDIIKRLNSENNIIFKSQRFSSNLIDSVDVKIKLAYGRLNISKNLLISKTKLNCLGDVNLLKEFPIYYFECTINSPNKKKFLKLIKVENNLNGQELNLSVKGNLNILNRKINFDNIEMDKKYKATQEDLNFYKKSFEKNLFDKNFIKIFDMEKIKNFLTDIL